MPNTTGPLGEPPQVIARDPEAHRKLDELTKAVQTILAWIQGDQMAGIPGMAAEHRKHGERLDVVEERVERQSGRIRDAEKRIADQQSQIDDLIADRAAAQDNRRWTWRTVVDRLITAAIGALVAGLTFPKPPQPPHP